MSVKLIILAATYCLCYVMDSWLPLSIQNSPLCLLGFARLQSTRASVSAHSHSITQLHGCTALQDVQQQLSDQFTATLCEQPSPFWGSRFSTAEADRARRCKERPECRADGGALDVQEGKRLSEA